MKKITIYLLCSVLPAILAHAGVIEKTYHFGKGSLVKNGIYTSLTFPNTLQSGIPGEPVLPYRDIVLALPPGESAVSIEIKEEDDSILPDRYLLYPKQFVHPAFGNFSSSLYRNETVYRQNKPYPAGHEGHLLTQFLDGVAFALCSFTPVTYNPAQGQVSFSRKVTVRILTKTDPVSQEAMKNLATGSPALAQLLREFAQNPEMIDQYTRLPKSASSYDYLVVTPSVFQNEFRPFITMYEGMGIAVRVMTTENISSTVTGVDLQEKIRNYIHGEYQANGIRYVLLAGNNTYVPSRAFYCHVNSGGGYDDWTIPADLYYSGMDGNYDANGNHVYGEITDNPDLLPEISVGRWPVADTVELHHILHKTIAYKTNPVTGEFNRPLLAGEYLYASPLTFGGSYMNLLENNHPDNGYFTYGIPTTSNVVRKLYDSINAGNNSVGSWTPAILLAKINSGCSFIHHLGHANTSYMLRFNLTDITDQNFSQVNGINHNYTFLYTQGCYCGAFDQPGCIASKAITISNFLAGGVFNSRYGWFDEGTTEGPSEHLEREFVSAMYNDTLSERHLGTAHVISKIKTAPWISLPGEFEPGAQRWCQYCSNVFGDPALEIHIADPEVFPSISWTGAIDTDWNKSGNWTPSVLPTSLTDVVVPSTVNKPVINTVNSAYCHNLTIKAGATVNVNTGKNIYVRGTVVMEKEQ